ncbi:hypothetical protein [Persephonella sp.]
MKEKDRLKKLKSIGDTVFIIVYILFLVLVILFAMFLHIAYIKPYIEEEYGHLHAYVSQAIYISLVILLLVIYMSKDKKRAKGWIMTAVFIALLQILYMEYKHFLIYYKNFTYKIIFLKEGKEFWTWKHKDLENLIEEHTTKFVNIPEKYKSYNKYELIELINKLQADCDLIKANEQNVNVSKYVCKSDDGLKYEFKVVEVDNPDKCHIKIKNIKGNAYFEICQKGNLWYVKAVRYAVRERYVYEGEKILIDLKNKFSNNRGGR